MDAELKSKWVTALRSNEYTQGSGYLKQQHPVTGGVRHCCLGVLAEVMGVPSHPSAQQNGSFVFAFESADENAYLPFDEDADDFVFDYEIQSELARMNDTGKTFSEIADHIEAVL